jgi:hypothetical protein
MKLNFDHSWKILLAWKTAIYYIVILCIFSVFVSSSCRIQSQPRLAPGPPPPDISDCTRIELRYSPSKFGYFITTGKNYELFSHEEVNDVESLVPTVIDDPEIIKELAHDVNQGTFLHYSRKGGQTSIIHFINIIGYRNGEFVTAFIKANKNVLTGTKEYVYENDVWPSLEKLRSPSLTSKITSLRLRNNCKANMARLWRFTTQDPWNKTNQYPVPSKWCDAVLQGYPPGKDAFKCPSADDGKSHYAINPDCKSDSPLDTVLLFETKAGWNQHGGPELFTFDNHDPKGGCVLLNDGTVKFIRTKEELQQLHWK